jgi:hypothetical protein
LQAPEFTAEKKTNFFLNFKPPDSIRGQGKILASIIQNQMTFAFCLELSPVRSCWGFCLCGKAMLLSAFISVELLGRFEQFKASVRRILGAAMA